MRRVPIFFILVFLLGCASAPTVHFSRIEEAKVEVKGVQRIAVLDILSDGPVNLGTYALTELASQLAYQGRFQLVERSAIEKVLREIALGQTGVLADSSAKQAGQLLGADAVIVGEVRSAVSEQRGKEKVEKKEGTGQYEEYEEKEHVLWGKVVKKKREIMKTVLVDQDYLARSGGAAVSLRLVSVQTGAVLASFSDERTFSKKAQGSGEISRLPAGTTTLERLVPDLVERFVWTISPHEVWERRTLLRGDKGDPLVPRGNAYALEGLWDEAERQWKQAVALNPGYGAAYNNLAVSYERSFKLSEAEDAYRLALSLAPDNRDVIENLQRLRRWHKSNAAKGPGGGK